MPEDRKYDYGYDGDGGPDNGNDGDLSEWIPVLIFLVCFPPVGVVLLVLKLMGITGKGGRRQGSRHPYDLQREASQTGGERRYYRQAQAVNQNPKKKKKYVRKPDRDAPILPLHHSPQRKPHFPSACAHSFLSFPPHRFLPYRYETVLRHIPYP